MMIELTIRHDKLFCEKEYIIEGCKNFYIFKADFSEDWNNLDKFLTVPGVSEPIAFNENNEVILPPFFKRNVNIAVLGKKSDNIIAATNYHSFYVKAGAKEIYDIPPAPDNPATWGTYLGEVAKNEIDKITNIYSGKLCGFTWHVDFDTVFDKKGKSYGKLSDCMTNDFSGTWFYVRKSNSEAGMAQYPETYTIDGANGYLSLRDYVIWTGNRLVHIPTFEAKASDVKNSDGQYSPKSGVDGLMSSTDKAYLGDLAKRFISACDSGTKWSPGLTESGLYGNIMSGRPGERLHNHRLQHLSGLLKAHCCIYLAL